MIGAVLGQTGYPNPWRFALHPEVIGLVLCLIVAYVYMVRVIGPVAVRAGEQAVTKRQVGCFVAAMTMLFVASYWPIHDLGEQYLYSAHMLQHMMLSYFLPPLALLATPEWLFRTLIGDGRVYRAMRWLCHPVVAGVIFNVAVMVTHVPGVVDASLANGPLHYALHFMVVITALLMWMPVCGPIPEFHIGTMPKMIYLFLQSVIPTVPAGWLTFADGVVYKPYGEQPVRVWGMSATTDQQLAGAIMKIGGSMFLWTIVIFLWFRRFSASYATENDYHRTAPAAPDAADVAALPDAADVAALPDAADVADVAVPELTYDDVELAFARTPAPPDPRG